jgi:protease I
MTIACILDSDFEDSELRVPYDRLTGAGFRVEIIGKRAGLELVGKKGKERVRADRGIDDARVDDYDALFIPGGFSPDKLRADQRFVEFVKEFDRAGKLIAAVCHGPQLLLSAERVHGRTLTAWKTVQIDLHLAGANVVDREVVVDGNLITSRKPEDLEAFSSAVLDALGAGAGATPAA